MKRIFCAMIVSFLSFGSINAYATPKPVPRGGMCSRANHNRFLILSSDSKKMASYEFLNGKLTRVRMKLNYGTPSGASQPNAISRPAKMSFPAQMSQPTQMSGVAPRSEKPGQNILIDVAFDANGAMKEAKMRKDLGSIEFFNGDALKSPRIRFFMNQVESLQPAWRDVMECCVRRFAKTGPQNDELCVDAEYADLF